jgi:hypothetical protein
LREIWRIKAISAKREKDEKEKDERQTKMVLKYGKCSG